MLSLFKNRKVKRFDLPTRHYDERQEKIDAIKEKYNVDKTTVNNKPSVRNFRAEWENRNIQGTSGSGSSSTRLLVIIAILVFVAWFFLVRDNEWINIL